MSSQDETSSAQFQREQEQSQEAMEKARVARMASEYVRKTRPDLTITEGTAAAVAQKEMGTDRYLVSVGVKKEDGSTEHFQLWVNPKTQEITSANSEIL